MIIPRTLRGGILAMLLSGFAWWFATPCDAAPSGDEDFTALQASAKESFQAKVVPFVTAYCERGHGEKRQKGHVNFQPALKKPGDTSYRKQWKKSLASVMAHD